MVLITIEGRPNESIQLVDGCNTELVEKKLLNAFGPGLLKQGGKIVISDSLSGDYTYHLTESKLLSYNFVQVLIFCLIDQNKGYTCTVHSGRQKVTTRVYSYDQLVDFVLDQWSIFVFQKFALYVDSISDESQLFEDLSLLSNKQNNKIIVKSLIRGFSEIDDLTVLKQINGEFTFYHSNQ